MVLGEDLFADVGRDRCQAVSDFLGRFRRSDGGYAKTDRSGQSSTYHTFLATACKQIVDAPADDAGPIIALMQRPPA